MFPRAAVQPFHAPVLRAFLAAVLAFAIVFPGYSQDAEMGSIRGEVTNAATGKRLVNAEVRIEGTNRVAYTDQYGVFRFSNIPPGEYTIVARHTGLRDRRVTINVQPGETTVSEILLAQADSEVSDEDIVVMAEFEVTTSDLEGNSIALNEQRTSENLKTVMHAEAFGEITEGNIGEYLKNLPGVSVNYVAADVRSIKLRGMSSQFTNVTVDGAKMASAGSGNKIRSFELEQISLSNVEMLEVTKLPRPMDEANSLGGSVNLVSKNAFQRGGRSLTYKLWLNANSEYMELGTSPGWNGDRERRKVWPGVELFYTDVLLDNRLGVSIGYSNSNNFNIQQRFRWREWGFSPRGGQGGPEDVYFLRQQIQDGPKFTNRQSVSANIDYKFTENAIFSLRSQFNHYSSEFRNRNRDWRIDGRASSGFDDTLASNTFTIGPERSTAIGGSWRDKFGDTLHVDASMKHYMGDWTLDYGLWYSNATNKYADAEHGTLETISTDVNGIETLAFMQESAMAAYTDIFAFDEDGNLLPDRGIILENTDWDRAHTRAKDSRDRIGGARINLRRDFDVGGNRANIQVGARATRESRYAYENRFRWATIGEADNLTLADFEDKVYTNISPGFGYEGWRWPSSEQMRDYFLAHPEQFDFDEADSFNRKTSSMFDMKENITAAYIQGEIKLLEGKLSMLGGIRWENTDIEGEVPAFTGKYQDMEGDGWVGEGFIAEDGTIVVDKAHSETSYDTFHPSLHLKWEPRDNLIFRLSYANTLGRPNFQDMFGVTTINDPDPADPDDNTGTIRISNPALKPRRSNNFDLTAEYYFNPVGVFSVSVFKNYMSNYVQNVTREVTAADVATYGLPERVLGGNGIDPYRITLPETLGDGTVTGIEINWNQGLNYNWVPEMFRGSSVYANGTFLDTSGDFGASSPFTDDFPDFAKKTVSYGFILDFWRINMKFRWNIRGREIFASSTSGLATVRNYTLHGVSGQTALEVEERRTLDWNMNVKLTDSMEFFVNARNILNAPYRQVYYLPGPDGDYPILDSEQRFGAQWTFGIKGKF